ncbi:hypothetical protein P7H22_00015 [Paenibacillus larvae]|nr:hypothetical protein [Paenibacillus larvae]MDT2239099.1 hypothetical protein [Paenibacillus larvae]
MHPVEWEKWNGTGWKPSANEPGGERVASDGGRAPGTTASGAYLGSVIESLKQLGTCPCGVDGCGCVWHVAVFVKTESSSDPLGGAEEDEFTNESIYKLGNGAIVGLGPNESVETANPRTTQYSV